MIVSPETEAYLDRLQPTQDALQNAMEASGQKRGFPIIGPLVGRLCYQWALGIGARSVFEMGSGFGYSTLHFARAVGPKGRVVHTDGDKGLSKEAREWLGQAGLDQRVDFRVGNAMDLLRQDPATYDVVFIDVDKEQYPEAFAAARTHVRVGGLIITDNTLWQGKAALSGKADAATKGVQEYNRLAFNDPGLHSVLVPIRDGVTVSLRTA